jgi:hypothetical protein
MTAPTQGHWFRSTGKSLIPADSEAIEALSRVGANSVVRVKVVKPRRPKFHRWFFVIIKNYFDNWPTSHSFQPDDEEHLRAWATVKSGHRDIFGERLSHTDRDIHRMADFVEKAIQRSRKTHSFITIFNGSLVMLTPKSIAFDALDQAAFEPIADKILGVLETESGIAVSSMMEAA